MVNRYVDRLLVWLFGMNWEELSYGYAEIDLDNEVDVMTERKYDRRLFLKIKLKNLRDEVALIRSHEDHLKEVIHGKNGNAPHEEGLLRQMIDHRRRDLREESRATLLAYAMLRGRRYEEIEPRVSYEPAHRVKYRVTRVAKMVHKYSVMDFNPAMLGSIEDETRVWMSVDKDGNRIVHNQSVAPVAGAA